MVGHDTAPRQTGFTAKNGRQAIEVERIFMRAGRRQFTLIVAAYLGACLLGWSRPGYLTVVGPAALRFFAPPPPAPRLPPAPIPMPVVSTNSAPVTPVKQDAEETAAGPGAETNVPALPPGPDMSGQTNGPGGGLGTPKPEDVVSPQMLMQYFNKTGNGTATSIYAPVDVTPRPPTGSPSKAGYSNGP